MAKIEPVSHLLKETPESTGLSEAAGVARRFLNGVTLGGSEYLASKTDDYYPPAETGGIGTAAEILGGVAGGIGVGTPVRAGVKAGISRLFPSLLEKAPRATRAAIGAVESGAIGGTSAAVQGKGIGDIASRAGTDALIGGAIEAPVSIAGYLWGQGIWRLPGVGPKRPKVSANPTIANPFRRPAKSEWEGMNTGLMEIAEREGIPLIPGVVRPNDTLPHWLAMKAQQSSAVQPYLAELSQRIDDGFRKWQGRIVESMRTTSPARQRETGEVLQGQYTRYLEDELMGKASQMYEDALAQGVGEFGFDGSVVARELRDLLKEEGFDGVPDPAANKIRGLIARLEDAPTRQIGDDATALGTQETPYITFNELWKESQRLYPKKKSGWTSGDYLAAHARRVVKERIREDAAKVHPQAESIFQAADARWARAHELEDSDLGKALRANPEKIVDSLTSNVTMLREVRREMGDDFADALAQRKIATLFSDSIDPHTGEIDSGRLNSAMKSIGGTHGNIDNEYLDELLKTHPEVRNAIVDLQETLRMYDDYRSALNPRYEQVGGGAETQSIPALVSNMGNALVLLGNFVSGNPIGKLMTQPRSVNPLLGGARPAMAESTAPMSFVRTLRRSTAAQDK